MKYPLQTLLLSPVLLAQALYVRKVTPRLPEPDGERAGVAGAGAGIRVLIAGDSAAAGVGVTSQLEALSGRLAACLSQTHQVSWRLLAQTGHTAGDVLSRLREAEPEPFDIALLSIGVNDVTGGTRSGRWRIHLAAIIDLLQTRFGVRHVVLTGLPPMHLFPALPQPLRWWLGVRASQLNAALADIVAADRRSSLLIVEFPFEEGYMAVDGFHPGSRAYGLWASHAAEMIRQRLSQGAGGAAVISQSL